MIISIDAEKIFAKNPTVFHNKNRKLGIEGELSQNDKRRLQKNPPLISYSMIRDFLPKIGTRHGSLLSLLLFSFILEVLDREITQEK